MYQMTRMNECVWLKASPSQGKSRRNRRICCNMLAESLWWFNEDNSDASSESSKALEERQEKQIGQDLCNNHVVGDHTILSPEIRGESVIPDLPLAENNLQNSNVEMNFLSTYLRTIISFEMIKIERTIFQLISKIEGTILHIWIFDWRYNFFFHLFPTSVSRFYFLISLSLCFFFSWLNLWIWCFFGYNRIAFYLFIYVGFCRIRVWIQLSRN